MSSYDDRGLTTFERAVLVKLLAGDHPVLAALRSQLASCRVRSREITGHGFFTNLDVDRKANTAAPVQKARIRDVGGEIRGLGHGAGFVVFVADGYLDFLEGFSYEEQWPQEITEFALMYERDRTKDAGAINLPVS